MIRMIVVAGIFVSVPAVAAQTDKDIVRDACIAQKAPAKRNECLDAVERLSSAAASAARPPTSAVEESTKPVPNMRAMECSQFEYSELDAMSRNELQGVLCSIDMGVRLNDESTAKAAAAKDDPRLKAALLARNIAFMERCQTQRSKANDLLVRKFNAKSDCSSFPKGTLVDHKDGLSAWVREHARAALRGDGCDPAGELAAEKTAEQVFEVTSQCHGGPARTVRCVDGSCTALPVVTW